MEFLETHSTLIQTLLQATVAFAWLISIYLLLMNFLRQRQSVILINRGTARGKLARCYVTNMGSEPIYLLAAFVYLESVSDSYLAPVTERDELHLEDLNHPSEASNQGPLKTGEVRDIGDFATLEKRARDKATDTSPPDVPDRFSVVIVAISGHAAHLVGAQQTFSVAGPPNDLNYLPTSAVARQIKNFARSQWGHLLDDLS